MSALQIDVSVQLNGMTFSLAPSIRELIRKFFPKALPANTVFIAYDVKSDFKHQHGDVFQYVPSALTSLSKDEVLEHFSEIQFVDPVKGTIIETMTRPGKRNGA